MFGDISGSAAVTRGVAVTIQQRSSRLMSETQRFCGEVSNFLANISIDKHNPYPHRP